MQRPEKRSTEWLEGKQRPGNGKSNKPPDGAGTSSFVSGKPQTLVEKYW